MLADRNSRTKLCQYFSKIHKYIIMDCFCLELNSETNIGGRYYAKYQKNHWHDNLYNPFVASLKALKLYFSSHTFIASSHYSLRQIYQVKPINNQTTLIFLAGLVCHVSDALLEVEVDEVTLYVAKGLQPSGQQLSGELESYSGSCKHYSKVPI